MPYCRGRQDNQAVKVGHCRYNGMQHFSHPELPAICKDMARQGIECLICLSLPFNTVETYGPKKVTMITTQIFAADGARA